MDDDPTRQETDPVRPTRRRVVIRKVLPEVAGGRFPAAATAGRPVDVAADLICDGHDALAGVVRWKAEGTRGWNEERLRHDVNDRWVASFTPPAPGRYRFTIDAWVDHIGTWRRDLQARAAADAVEEIDLAIGAALLEDLADGAKGAKAQGVRRAAAIVGDTSIDRASRVEVALADELTALTDVLDPRAHRTRYDRPLELRVDRERAAFSTWYELFPRSASTEPGTHGTLRDVIERLDHIRSMGFDVVYLPPIHPIGLAHRKGRNNSVDAGPDDPGSPWAIGGAEGGHDTIHPDLGTEEDLRALMVALEERGMELAMDIAFQCSPDHPWVTEHPEWFKARPDGSIQYAENPPKKYQDIYPLDFETSDPEGLWAALKGVFEHWIAEGVRIFRVDNPHTKSMAFWGWCFDELTREHPDCIFLAEAFTRPKRMYELAMRGFTQSYTYFTWRRHKWEIEQYYQELFHTEVVDFFRPNSWPNTPDILTDQLQSGSRAMYVQRLVLAATLTANYGMYGPAFELMWSEARPGAEEYLDNEKYEIKRWDADQQPHSLHEVIALINRIRHEHPALQQDRTLAFHHVDNDQLLAYSKRSRDGDDTILVVVNLDPTWTQSGFTWLDHEALGLGDDEQFHVEDLFAGGTFLWQGRRNFVELDPNVTPAHVFRVRPLRSTSEHDFDAFT
jgi:starch synthase (maltosyl-transferring)